MTTLTDRPSTALLVVDMQHEVLATTHEPDTVVANINTLVDRAREADVPVIWVQHHDENLPVESDGWQLVDELVPHDGEPVVAKSYGDSFESTDLEAVLGERKVGRLVVTGAHTDACIRSTLHGALARGYDVTLVADAHTTADLRQFGSPMSPEEAITYTNIYWSVSRAPGRTCTTVPTAELSFAG